MNRIHIRDNLAHTAILHLHGIVFLPKLNRVVRQYTAFIDFKDLMYSHQNYSPTLYTQAASTRLERAALTWLANKYDQVMELLGDDRRAHRV